MSVDVRVRAIEDTENDKLRFEIHLDRFGATDLELAAAQRIYPKVANLIEIVTHEVENPPEEPSRIIVP